MPRRVMGFALAGLAVAVVAAMAGAPFASSAPDGLERVAEDHGFSTDNGQPARGPIPDYQMPGVKHGGLATALAGATGTLAAFGAAWALGRGVQNRRRNASTGEEQP